MTEPQTLEEWEAYVNTIPAHELGELCEAANSFQFTEQLLAEGCPMDDIRTIILFFVRRMVELEIKLPEGGAFPLYDMMQSDPLARLR